MKMAQAFSVAAIFFSVNLFLPVSGANAQEWQLAWQDEFNYSGLPDAAKWGYDVGNGGWGNNELQNYTANRTENARVENGTLIVEARRDWYNGIEYSSARLVTKNKGDWKYGRIEVKAKIPLGQGLWPAIWMLPTTSVYGGWPASGEIDIMENFALGGIKPNSIEGNIHTQAYNHKIGTNKGATKAGLSDIQQNYHVYALSWYENRLDFEVDGSIYFTFNNEGTWQTWPYDQKFHLILNLAVGGTLGTTPDANIFPKRMTVDYVRVYQKGVVIPATTGLVTAYRDDQYKGHSIGLSPGDYKLADLKKLGMSDNDITSLKVTQGYRAILFENDNFAGASKTITADNPNVGTDWNDRASSVRIETNGVTGLNGTYFLENRKSGFFMEATGGTGAVDNGVNVLQWNFTYKTNQQLVFTHLSNGTYKIIFKHSGKGLDIQESSKDNGGNVHQWEYKNLANQQFVVVSAGSGYYKLIAKHSGKLVEIPGDNNASGANVRQWTNNNQQNGQWKLNPVVATSTGLVTCFKDAKYASQSIGLTTGSYTLADLKKLGMIDNDISSVKVTEGYKATLFVNDNFSGTSKVLTANASDLGTDWSNKVSSIRVETAGDSTLAGTWYIQNKATGLYMSIGSGTTDSADGTAIRQRELERESNQQVTFVHLGNGTYKLLAGHSGKAVDISAVSTADGAKVQQWKYTGSANQQFVAVSGADGTIKLIAKHSGKVVEVTEGSTTSGAPLQQMANTDQEYALWTLVDIHSTAAGYVTGPVYTAGIQAMTAHAVYFTVPKDGYYSLKIMQVNGRIISTSGMSFCKAGSHSLSLNNEPLSHSVCIAVLEGEGLQTVFRGIIR